MLPKKTDIHFRIINRWLVFILFLVIISNLPHQKAPFFSWLNVSVYFLIFLQASALLAREKSNRLIYLSLALFALFHSLSFANIFVGEGNLIPDDYLRYYLFEYKHILLSGITALCIIHICLRYFLRELSELRTFALSAALVVAVILWQYYPFLVDKEYILDVEDSILYKSVMLFDFLPLLFLFLYGFLLYRYDWSLGEHINTLMVTFFIMTIMDLTNYFGNIYEITIFQYTQYVLLTNLALMLITTTRLVNYSFSSFGQLHQSILVTGDTLGIPIKRKRTSGAILLDFTKAYFNERRNTVAIIALCGLWCVNFFGSSIFVKINVGVMLIASLILFYYLTALYQKRLDSGNILNLRGKREAGLRARKHS